MGRWHQHALSPQFRSVAGHCNFTKPAQLSHSAADGVNRLPVNNEQPLTHVVILGVAVDIIAHNVSTKLDDVRPCRAADRQE